MSSFSEMAKTRRQAKSQLLESLSQGGLDGFSQIAASSVVAPHGTDSADQDLVQGCGIPKCYNNAQKARALSSKVRRCRLTPPSG